MVAVDAAERKRRRVRGAGRPVRMISIDAAWPPLPARLRSESDGGPMEFSVGNALGKSIGAWVRNIVPFTILSVIVHAPLIVLWFMLLGGDFEGTESEVVRLAILALVFKFVLGGLLIGTVTYGVVMELRGQRASFLACIGVGLSRFLPLVLVTILFYLGVFAGFIALVVPGFILLCMWFVALPASVIERPGIGGAFRRSSALTEGVRGQIFALVLLVYGGQWVIGKILENKFDGPYETREALLSDLRTYAIFDTVSGVLFSSFAAVLAAVVYAQLRYSKDGTSADELARVFD
jgi:hypothetical protein